MFSDRDNNLLYIKEAFRKSFSSRLHQNFFNGAFLTEDSNFVEMKRITKKYSKNAAKRSQFCREKYKRNAFYS